jgi:hypothetical protein
MNIAEHDIAAIRALGYTEDEARFLYIVATHSGYFVPRQFLALTGSKWGYRTDQLTKKLESRGHASWREYEGAGGVYHLFGRRLYADIGKANLRNRRRHSVEFIKTRLVLLDFVIANCEYNYLETEQQKVDYFCGQLGLPKKSLPAKSYDGAQSVEPTLRYFVDKHPLFVEPSDSSSSPVVTFSFVDPGLASIKAFSTHLDAYALLFRELPEFRFVYIANSTANFVAAESCFLKRFAPAGSDGSSDELLRYFRLRKAWEQKKYALFSNSDIEWLNDATRRFATRRIESLYAGWCAGEVVEPDLRQEFPRANPRTTIAFETCLVQPSGSPSRQAGKPLKSSSVPDFRHRHFPLQPSAEVNFAETREIASDEKTRNNAAKFK